MTNYLVLVALAIGLLLVLRSTRKAKHDARHASKLARLRDLLTRQEITVNHAWQMPSGEC